MKRLLAIGAVAVVAAALAAPVLACGSGWIGKNLVATPKVKAALRVAYLEAHPFLTPNTCKRKAATHASQEKNRQALQKFQRRRR